MQGVRCPVPDRGCDPQHAPSRGTSCGRGPGPTYMSPQPRRPYLVNRLVSGQITLEEARELFAAMQRDLEDLRSTPVGQVASPTVPEGATPPPPPPPASSSKEMSLEEILLLIGPAAGIFAALLKRSKDPH